MIIKSEIRNPKSETVFKISNFEFVSKFVLRASCLLVLFAPLTVFAQGFVPLAPIPGLTEGATADTAGLATFFNNLYKYLIGLAAALAVIQITWAGLDIAIWHKDAVSAITDDKEKIYNAIFGLILVLSPVLVFSIINPSILNLSLNLPKLDTTTSIPNTTVTLPGGGTGYTEGTVAPSGQYCFSAVLVATIGKNSDIKAQLQCYPDMKSCTDNKQIMEADKKTYLVPESSLCLLTQKLK